ncbi:uncharacterized protein LOC134245000 [Saccostrea cucullata]|uniref:uncharacterized protein LOC134245000 n=1 Tax=Saccostrea cuccullata TaxID=36930 RepID=UPI002ED3C81F
MDDILRTGNYVKNLEHLRRCAIGNDMHEVCQNNPLEATLRYPELFSREMTKKRLIIDKWTEERRKFYPTRAFKEVERKLKMAVTVTVSGNSGCGKSALAQQVAISYLTNGWQVIPVTDVADIATFADIRVADKLFFVIDDPIGREGIDEQFIRNWRTYEPLFDPLQESDYIKILITCRTSVLRQHQEFRLLHKNVVIIDDGSLSLSIHEKDSILHLHYPKSNNLSKTELNQILETNDYFPLLCFLFGSNKKYQSIGSKFFVLPSIVIEDEITYYKFHNRWKYCTLVLLFTQGGIMNKRSFINNANVYDYETICDVCGLSQENKSFRTSNIMEQMQNLNGSLLTMDGENIRFRYNFIMNIMAYIFGNDNPENFIRFSPVQFLRKMDVVGDTIHVTGLPYLTLNLSDCASFLCERFFSDIQKNLVEICVCSLYQNEKIQKIIVEGIEMLSGEKLKDLFLKPPMKRSFTVYSYISSIFHRASQCKELMLLAACITHDEFIEDEIGNELRLVLQRYKEFMNGLDEFTRQKIEDLISNYFEEVSQSIDSLVTFYASSKDDEDNHSVSSTFSNDTYHSDISSNSADNEYSDHCDISWNSDDNEYSDYGDISWNSDDNEYSDHGDISCNCVQLFQSLYSSIDEETIACLENSFHKLIRNIVESVPPNLREKTNNFVLDIIKKMSCIFVMIIEKYNLISSEEVETMKRTHSSTVLYSSMLIHPDNANLTRTILSFLNNPGISRYFTYPSAAQLKLLTDLLHDATLGSLQFKLELAIYAYDISPLACILMFDHNEIFLAIFHSLLKMNVEKETLRSQNIFIAACANGNIDIVKQITWALGHSVINSKWHCLQTDFHALHVAAALHHDHVTEYLLKTGVSVNTTDFHGNTPLHAAISNMQVLLSQQQITRSWRTIKLLRKFHANIYIQNNAGFLPLHYACLSNYVYVVQFVLDKMKINTKTSFDDSPLLLATRSRCIDVVEFLLLNGACVDQSNNIGCTPLHEAAKNGCMKITEILLRSNCNLNIKDVSGKIPVVFAVLHGHVEVVRRLIENRQTIEQCDKSGDDALAHASYGGNLDIVKLLLGNNADVNHTNCNKDTPLCHAAIKGHVRIAEELIQCGANKNHRNANGETPLILASIHGQTEVVKFLLEKGVDINCQDKKKRSPLWVSCYKGHSEVTAVLIAHKSKSELCDESNVSPLFIAAEYGNLGSLLQLLQQRDPVNLRNLEGKTVLMIACEKGHIEIVCILLDYGADLELSDKNGRTALWYASQGGFLPIIQVLLDNGADINKVGEDRMGPLHIATEHGHVNTVLLLLKHNANTDLRNKRNMDPFTIACEKGHVSVVKLYKDYGLNVNRQGFSYNSPLFVAVQREREDVVKLLLEMGANARMSDEDENTALHHAADRGNVHLVDILSQNAVLIDFQNQYDETALYISCKKGHYKTVQWLLKRNADINIRNHDGYTPLIVAAEHGHNKTISILIENNANINEKDRNGQNPLVHAVRERLLSTVLYLVKLADINAKDSFGRSSLWYAIENRDFDISTALIKRGAFINQQDNSGLTPLHAACAAGHVDAVSFLLERGADVNCIDFKMRTPLWISSHTLQRDISETLLHSNADPNLCDYKGDTPVLIAAKRNGPSVLKLLLCNIDINHQNIEKQTVLMFVSQFGHLELTEELIALKANVNAQDVHGFSSLIFAAKNGHIDVVRILVESCADINTKDAEQRDALYYACQKGHIEVAQFLMEKILKFYVHKSLDSSSLHKNRFYKGSLRSGLSEPEFEEYKRTLFLTAVENESVNVVTLLLKNGSDINFKDSCNQTPLIIASKKGHYTTAKILIEMGSIVDTVDDNGRSPLWYASAYGFIEIVKLLLQNHANINQPDEHQISPLHIAVKNNHILIFEHLLQNKACENFANAADFNESNVNTLFMAIVWGNFDVIKMIINSGCDVNIHNCNHVSAIILAASEGNSKIVQLLIDSGANANDYDNNGRTPLWYASANDFVNTVNTLLQNKADPNISDINGLNPLYIATVRGCSAVVNTLLTQGAHFVYHKYIEQSLLWISVAMNHVKTYKVILAQTGNYYCKKSMSELFLLASFCGYEKFIEMFLEEGISVNCVNKGFETPLHLAISKGHTNIAKLLIEKGAEVNSKDIGGRTALWYASKKGLLDILRLLLKNSGDVNESDINAILPVDIAKQYRQNHALQMLLAYGEN